MSEEPLMGGLAGAGKSTYARDLDRRGWIRFSIDNDAWRMGYTEARKIPGEVAADIRAQQRLSIARALAAGGDVVVDYSFWSRAQRDESRDLGRSHDVSVALVHVETAELVLRRRLAERRGSHQDDSLVEEGLLDEYLAGFEPPGPAERDVTVVTTTR